MDWGEISNLEYQCISANGLRTTEKTGGGYCTSESVLHLL